MACKISSRVKSVSTPSTSRGDRFRGLSTLSKKSLPSGRRIRTAPSFSASSNSSAGRASASSNVNSFTGTPFWKMCTWRDAVWLAFPSTRRSFTRFPTSTASECSSLRSPPGWRRSSSRTGQKRGPLRLCPRLREVPTDAAARAPRRLTCRTFPSRRPSCRSE